MNNSTPLPPGLSTFDIPQFVASLWDNRWRVLVVTATFFVAAVSFVLLATPIYRADAVLQVEQRVPTLPGLSEISQSLGVGGASPEAATEMALITSRSVVGGAVDAMRMTIEITPRRVPLLGAWSSRGHRAGEPDALQTPWLGMSSFGWGGEDLVIRRLEVPDELLEQKLQLRVGDAGAYTLYDQDEKSLATGKVGQPAVDGEVMIEVERLQANPGMRFDVVRHARLPVVVAKQKQIAVRELGKDSGILALGYDDADPALAQQFLQHVAEAYVRQNADRSAAEASAQLSFVQKQLPGLRQQVDSAQKNLSSYQVKADSVDLGLQTKGLLDQEVALESSLQSLRLQQADIERRFTRDHPAYQALMQQIGSLQARKGGLQSQVKQLPAAQQEVLRLTRDLQVGNEMYTSMLAHAQQLDLARAGSVGNVRIIDDAAVDDSRPVKPRKSLLVLVITAVGIFAGVGQVLLQQVFKRGLDDGAQIEQIGLPVYASIPESAQQAVGSRRGQVLALAYPNELAVEAVRSLRTSLHFARLEASNNIVLLSGASPDVGKSFVAENLACTLAQAGQRTLLIDADMRRGRLHKALGMDEARGLSELLAGVASSDEVVRSVPGQLALEFISRGHVPPNPSELLMRGELPRILAELAPRFDVVIIDTPPVLAVTDAVILARHAAINLLVARFGITQLKELELARARFEQNDVRLKGAIFNGIKRRTAGYGSYSYVDYT